MIIRAAGAEDREAIWTVIAPAITIGETLALARELSKEDSLSYWLSEGHEVFVAEDEGRVVGAYFLKANQRGGGSHVANCGYVTSPGASGRGIARRMCEHSMERAKERGFRSMQFNLVVSTNERAIRLWQSMGFVIVGRLPEAFLHPTQGYVDAFVMSRKLV